MKNPDPSPELRDPTLLFEEYLRAWDAGQALDLGDLCARAGPREGDLKKRIEIFRTLQELSDTLDTPSTDGTAVVDIDRIGRFEKLVRIGQGGLSQVFLAHDPALKRNVALKILSPDQITTSDARGWIATEAQSLARLDHPGVVRVFEVDEADGFAYVAMEFLAGPSLAAVIDRLRTRVPGEDPAVEAAAARLASVAARCRLVLQLARALAYCHEQGVVHRDIKPGNILLQSSGEPKLIDFGLAHLESDSASLTQVTQRLMGTPAYIAPEQVDRGRTGASPLSDQFSLGIVLYELLTSRNAFLRSSRSSTLDAISRAEPPAPRTVDASIPPDVERICLHALERLPDARYPSMGKMADDLEAFLEHRPISLRAPTPGQRLALWSRRHRREIGISATALGCALAVAIVASVIVVQQEHAALKDKFTQFGTSIERLVAPDHFVDRFGALQSAATEADTFDRSLAARVLGADASVLAMPILEQTSLRMRSILDEEWRGLANAQSMAPIEAARKLLLHWEDALKAEASACPDCKHNVRDRDRGLVELPALSAGESLRLWQYLDGPSPITPILRSIDPAPRLAPGLYRLQKFGASQRVEMEGEFLVSPEDEKRQLALRSLHPAIAARMIDIQPTKIFVRGPTDVQIGGHKIMRDPVRWSDLPLAGWSDKQCANAKASVESISNHKLGWDDPAALEWDVALGVAAALGARFPLGCELASFLQDSRVETPGRGTVFMGELVSSIITDDEFLGLHYDGTASEPNTQSYRTRSPLFGRGDNGKLRLMTFRLAYSAFE